MQFLTLAALFAAAATASPTPQTSPTPAYTEKAEITSFNLRKSRAEEITSVNFKLSGDNATNISCEIGATGVPSESVKCGDADSKYSFILNALEDPAMVKVAVYHETGLASGLWAEVSVPTYCRAGGMGFPDFICQQVAEVKFELHQ